MAGGGEFSDHNHLLAASEGDLEASHSPRSARHSSGKGGIKDLLIHLDRGISGRRLSFKRDRGGRDGDRDHHHHEDYGASGDVLGDSAPPEWALLLIGCFLGLATGLCVAAFNRGVSLLSALAIIFHLMIAFLMCVFC
uniref:Uncharacterized protein n=1 Tax=Kalanchoe fedtschenkoi TaxID=63787 RepID=A0A7N0ZV99_KALFE